MNYSRCCGCCSALVIITLVVVVTGGAVVAQTGIVRLPLVSDWWYVAPQPIRDVTPAPLPTAWPPALPARLSEEEATSALLQLLEHQPIDGVVIADAQIVIVPEGLELFVNMEQPLSAIITVMAKPVMVDGALALEPLALRVGNLPLPRSLAQRLMAPINRQLAVASQGLPKGLEKITVADGFLLFSR